MSNINNFVTITAQYKNVQFKGTFDLRVKIPGTISAFLTKSSFDIRVRSIKGEISDNFGHPYIERPLYFVLIVM